MKKDHLNCNTEKIILESINLIEKNDIKGSLNILEKHISCINAIDYKKYVLKLAEHCNIKESNINFKILKELELDPNDLKQDITILLLTIAYYHFKDDYDIMRLIIEHCYNIINPTDYKYMFVNKQLVEKIYDKYIMNVNFFLNNIANGFITYDILVILLLILIGEDIGIILKGLLKQNKILLNNPDLHFTFSKERHEEVINKTFKLNIKNHEGDFKSEVENIEKHYNDFDKQQKELYKYLSLKNTHACDMILDEYIYLSDPNTFNDFMDPLYRMQDNIITELIKTGQKPIGVACLTKVYDNTLMWGHYADGSRGVCIEYDLSSINFNSVETPYYKSKIMYFNKMLLNQGYYRSEKNILKPFFPSLCIKNSKWNYEKEYRIIGIIGHENNRKLRLKIKSITLGHLIDEDEDNKKKIGEAIKNKSNIKIYQATINIHNYNKFNRHDITDDFRKQYCQ